jgi:hypothetical protein
MWFNIGAPSPTARFSPVKLGVHDKVIQAILRHANVEVTRKHYIKTRSAASAKAMKRLGRAFRRTENRTEK